MDRSGAGRNKKRLRRSGHRRFAYRLAARLGIANVDRDLLARISSLQFMEWRAYADLEPFDEERADLRAAQICAILANVHRDKKKRPKPFQPKDFMFAFDRSPGAVRQTPEQIKQTMFMLMSIYNTKPQRGKVRA